MTVVVFLENKRVKHLSEDSPRHCGLNCGIFTLLTTDFGRFTPRPGWPPAVHQQLTTTSTKCSAIADFGLWSTDNGKRNAQNALRCQGAVSSEVSK